MLVASLDQQPLRLRAPVCALQCEAAAQPFTSIYLQGIDDAETIDTVHTRRAPMIPVSTSLRL